MTMTPDTAHTLEPLRILCLYSDWRWTGPAEPVLQMCRGLQDRGNSVTFACRAVPADVRGVDESTPGKARDYGLGVTTDFALDRYMGLGGTLRDLVGLPRYMRRNRIDVVHTNLSHDQALGALCARLCGRQRPLIVKTLHRRKVPSPTLGYRLGMRGPLAADGMFVFTPAFRQRYLDSFRLAPERIALQPMTIDLQRFTPDRDYRAMRPVFDIPEESVVIGIVTRFQEYRRMDTFVAAAAKVVAARPQARFLLLGWSGQIEDTVLKPVRASGLEQHVIIGGYRVDDYVDTLQCMDVFTLLMPGYDGTARALREAMAMGKACVVSDVGMLPEIVTDGHTGLVAGLTADGLAEHWLELVDDPAKRRRLGQAALEHARANFRLDHMAQTVEHCYRTWLAARGGTANASSQDPHHG